MYNLARMELLRSNQMNYRRVFVPGASYFFTLTLQDIRSDLLICKIKELRIAFQRVMKTSPFMIDGIVVLTEHMHMTMTLDPDDTNYSQRISFIKSAFSHQIEPLECINSSRRTKRERAHRRNPRALAVDPTSSVRKPFGLLAFWWGRLKPRRTGVGHVRAEAAEIRQVRSEDQSG